MSLNLGFWGAFFFFLFFPPPFLPSVSLNVLYSDDGWSVDAFECTPWAQP